MKETSSRFDFSDFIDEGFEKTDNLEQAIYVFKDGSLWSGYSEGGDGRIRDVDHGTIEAFFKDPSIDRYHPDFWSMTMEEMIQVVPENRLVLTLTDNHYTQEQLEVLHQLEEENFTIEQLESTIVKEVNQSKNIGSEYRLAIKTIEPEKLDYLATIIDEYEMEQPVSGMKAMNKLIENSYRQSLPEKDRPYIEEFSRNATISRELTFDDFDMEYTEYKVNGHPFYYKYAELDLDDEKKVLSEKLSEHLMKGNLRIEEVCVEDDLKNVSSQTNYYLKEKIELLSKTTNQVKKQNKSTKNEQLNEISLDY